MKGNWLEGVKSDKNRFDLNWNCRKRLNPKKNWAQKQRDCAGFLWIARSLHDRIERTAKKWPIEMVYWKFRWSNKQNTHRMTWKRGFLLLCSTMNVRAYVVWSNDIVDVYTLLRLKYNICYHIVGYLKIFVACCFSTDTFAIVNVAGCIDPAEHKHILTHIDKQTKNSFWTRTHCQQSANSSFDQTTKHFSSIASIENIKWDEIQSFHRQSEPFQRNSSVLQLFLSIIFCVYYFWRTWKHG